MAISDISMKKNILPISQALQKVLNMNGVYFSWNSDPLNNRRVGFIAQEMDQVLPEVVFTNAKAGHIDHISQVRIQFTYIPKQQVINSGI
jgi:hypothetical protein